MSTFTIEWMEKKTVSTGKEKYNATLKSVDTGAQTENVTIWSDYPAFQTLQPGSTVYGDLVQKDPKYGPTLYAPKVASTSPTRGAGAITKAMETKASNIRDAQENKENGIKVASTMNGAKDLAIAEYNATGGDLAFLIVKWRTWLWLQWDKTTTDDVVPF